MNNLENIDFFPKPSNKIITAKMAIDHIKNNYKENNLAFKKMKWLQKETTFGIAPVKIHPKRPCRTITKNGGINGGYRDIHYSKGRRLEIEELLLLSSFPEKWKLLGKPREKVDRIGNAVMPKFMEAIASRIKEILNMTNEKKDQYTVISTFAGTGGSSLGYKWAGFKELLAIDFDSHAVQCFKLNFPEVPVWHKSVLDITGQQILDFCKIKKGELDVFDGSPPCQGFSTAGKRQVNDPRNDLFKAYIKLIQELEPKVFVMENVTGMAKGKMKGKFIEIMKTLKSLNYNVKCKQMNAKYYGVPQSRQRLIFIGVRKDLNIEPSYPIPGRKIITVKEAFKQVEKVGHAPKTNNKFVKSILHKLKPGESFSKYHPKGSFFNGGRVHWTKPSFTLIKMVPVGGYIHPLENRMISINECKALCGFPQSWKLGDNYKLAFERLGNAVMPKFMQAIAENIRDNILERYYN